MRRIVYRGKQTTFRADFFEDENKTIPLTPASSSYPEYTIYDSAGLSVNTGVGLLDTSPGFYKISWVSTMTAALSSDTAKWRIEWLMVTTDGNSITYVDTFDMLDESVSASETFAQHILGISTSEIRVPLRLSSENSEVKMTILQAGTENVIWSPRLLSMGQVKMIEDGDSFVYYVDIPVNTLTSGISYSIMWEVRRTASSQVEMLFDKVICASPKVIQYFPNLRILIDKFQKQLGRVHAYEDADLYEYLQQGLKVVNGWHPVTAWNWVVYPEALDTFIIMGAAWWGLNAQYLLETDMAFSFSGQTVTLDVDRTGLIEGAISRFYDFLMEHLSKAKLSVVRASSPVGVLSVRPMRYDMTTRMFQIENSTAITPSFMNMIYSVFS